ncbi:MAG: MFS transporter [Saprospiraceae bacterium]|nr:MFS transporter [Saprospiraceae bacterium]
MKKPLLSFWDIWNMSFGFLGIQFGFALQNANASRILQSFGADTHQLSWFWLVAPITGMIIQPIIGHYSDRTWTKLGRRRPYFLGGAIAASIGLILMPNSGMLAAFIPALWVGAGMLMIMDASFNIAMEPFRALVADKLNTEQRTLGFSVQTVLIGVGAVIGSWLPYILAEWFGVAKDAADGAIPMNVIWSFVIGAIILISTIIWTVAKTSEYSPEEVAQFDDAEEEEEEIESKPLVRAIIEDFGTMPKTMRQLGLVQFCSWFALFGMWVFATPAIAQHIFGLAPDDTSSTTFQDAGNWVGIIFGVYNLVSAFYAFMLPTIAGKLGRKKTHSVSLIAGAVGLISIYFISNQYVLILSMVGVGIAWASILAMPYAILAGSIPAKKMGIYMGIFNFFITFPQIVNGVFGGLIVKYLYNDQAVLALVTSGVFLLIGAIAVLYVEDKDDVVAT